MKIQILNPKSTSMTSRGGTLSTLSCMNQYFTIKVPREVLGRNVIFSIDGGTHNFVNEKLVAANKMKIGPFFKF